MTTIQKNQVDLHFEGRELKPNPSELVCQPYLCSNRPSFSNFRDCSSLKSIFM